jgi:hypothetical protein
MSITRTQVQNLATSGGNVISTDGQKIGSIGQVYVERLDRRAELRDGEDRLFGTAESFVPCRTRP